ncbi:NADAR family protein, partial [bacterium]|nr:NADAR family protein [bacterium]
YMAEKALFFDDQFRYKKIMEETNPKAMKNHGRAVKGYSDEAWYGPNSVNSTIEENPAKKAMYDGNYLKYTQNEKLLNLLIDTRGTTLVEASPFDKRWGIGMKYCLAAHHSKFWKGKNWLGEVLTKLRDDLIKEREKNFLF